MERGQPRKNFPDQDGLIGPGRDESGESLLPRGLCGDRSDHFPHEHISVTLGTFRCSADQSEREPYRSERRKRS
jgi:hypothetical protein